MINISLTTKRVGVFGHAERPDEVPLGANIICAAVSALTLTLIEDLTCIAGEATKAQQCDGHIVIEWKMLSTVGQALVDT